MDSVLMKLRYPYPEREGAALSKCLKGMWPYLI